MKTEDKVCLPAGNFFTPDEELMKVSPEMELIEIKRYSIEYKLSNEFSERKKSLLAIWGSLGILIFCLFIISFVGYKFIPFLTQPKYFLLGAIVTICTLLTTVPFLYLVYLLLPESIEDLNKSNKLIKELVQKKQTILNEKSILLDKLLIQKLSK